MAHAISSAVTVRDIRGPDELRACQDLQRRAWGITEDGYVLPVATMAAAQRVGGLVLGAFDADALQPIGFAFAFLGKLHGEVLLYSQLTGVDPAHQSRGVGRLLKLEQRRRASEMGLATLMWAFDPLQASNAAFNLAVLGATSQTYEVDLYGSRSDTLNAGLDTDRLFAAWPTQGTTGGRTEPWPDGFEVIPTHPAVGQVRLPDAAREIPASAVRLHVEVPSNIADVKLIGAAAARQWQLTLRQALQAAFAAGFRAVGFARTDPSRPRYLLERTA